MKPARAPRPRVVMRLLVVDDEGTISHRGARDLPALVQRNDVVIANDAATLPASLAGTHLPSGETIELRLAGRSSLRPDAVTRLTAVVFGAGDYRTPTELRPAPPAVRLGDRIAFGSISARVAALHGHPRLVDVEFEEDVGRIWEALARTARPIQYAYVPDPLATWDTWTRIAALPVAFEAPSAGFVLDWSMLQSIRARGATFATITHAAGLSSTGDPGLDARLPLDEPYLIPPGTAAVIAAARRRGGRIIAVGTTVVRALESAAIADGVVRPGAGVATLRIGPHTGLRIVDAVVSGMHEPGTSHYELLRAFHASDVLERMNAEAESAGYEAHEFGDAVLVSRRAIDRTPRRNDDDVIRRSCAAA